MGFIGWIVLGLIAGAIAKAIMPGKQGGGFLVTLLPVCYTHLRAHETDS